MSNIESSTSPQDQRRLPDSWVQKIFSTMQGHYGSKWMNMWKIGQTLPDGSDAGIVNAMNHWAEKLGGYKDQPETLKRAMENLPTEPPTLPQFLVHLRQSYVEPNVLKIEKQWTAEELERNKQRATECMQQIRKMWSQKS